MIGGNEDHAVYFVDVNVHSATRRRPALNRSFALCGRALEIATMATTTGRARGASPRSASQKKSKRTGPGFMDRMRMHLRSASSALPQVAGSPRLRREVLGCFLIVIAILTALVLGRGGDDGRLVNWWGEALINTFGKAAPIAPLLIGLAAVRALGSQPGRVLEPRHLVGGFLFTMAIVGLLHLGGRPVGTMAGGYTGAGIGILLQRVLGEVGSGLALFVVGIFGVFLMAGSDLQTFWTDLRALGRLIYRACAMAWAGVVRAFRFVTPDLDRPRGIPVDAAPESGEEERRFASLYRRPVDPEPEPVDAFIPPAPRTRVRAAAGGNGSARPAAAAPVALAAPAARASVVDEPEIDLDDLAAATVATEAEWRPSPRRRAVMQPTPAPALPAPAAARVEPVIVMPAPSRREPEPAAAPTPTADDDDFARRLEAALADRATVAAPTPRADEPAERRTR
ncbi:MAG: DNA translocase FtsK 4TM domain-containing protein, partial [Thermomicrobiales bacterium]